MRNLQARVSKLEQDNAPPDRRPVLLVDADTDREAELTAWQKRYGPCDAEPLFIQLVGLEPAKQ